MNTRMASLLIVVLACVPTAAQALDQTQLFVGSYQPSKLLEYRQIKETRRQHQFDQEGWALVSYDLNAEGKVTRAEIYDSIGLRWLERAALKRVQSSVYQAAELNGRAVDSTNLVQLVLFNSRPGHAPRPSKTFNTLYQKSYDALYSDDSNARSVIYQELAQYQPTNFNENNRRTYLQAAYYTELQDWLKVYELRRLLVNNYRDALNGRQSLFNRLEFVAVAVELGHLRQAQRVLQLVEEQPEYKGQPQDSPTRAFVEELKTEILDLEQQEAPIQVLHRLSANRSWYHKPVREQFEVVVHQGEIAWLIFNCGDKAYKYNFVYNFRYSMPAGNNCGITVKADSDAELTLIEY
ncbi:hypothetical protein GCM10007895_08290 [Paraferrimonas sedimenticola]|uniref:TonB C-terminal domain-containing protein n=2 Tax=Paraferrimonas sedimenticola TaxID=375674 RepID=A0AA37RUN1_9GAMM|nr:energy transducer TonB [Paraferrimonas sedimenticola]GLP95523.1 hypothetical protein GCM10007895_08290 [Paraferrimonas sedimenticola]